MSSTFQNVVNKVLSIVPRRPILESLRNKKKFINRNIYLIENLNNYIQSQTVQKLPLFLFILVIRGYCISLKLPLFHSRF